MNRVLVKLAVRAAAATLLYSNLTAVQIGPYTAKELPPVKKTAHVHITQGPELELTNSNSVIIRWTIIS